MEELHHNYINEYDKLCSTDTITLLKALTLFLPVSYQSQVIICIKFLEIKQLMDISKHKSNSFVQLSFPKDITNIISDIKPSLSNPTAQKVEQISSLYQALEMYHQLQDLMEVMGSDFFSDGNNDKSSNATGNAFNAETLSNLLKGSLPEDKLAMIELLLSSQNNKASN